MSDTESTAATVAEVTAQALEIAENAPDGLKEAVFNKTFDQLMAGAIGIPTPARATNRKVARPAGNRHAEDAVATDDDTAVLIAGLDRTAHPEISDAPKSLDRSLHLLLIAENDFGIEGLTASSIAKILTEKFKLRITDPSVREALDKAGDLVDRVPRKKGGALYRIMKPGEDYLASGGAKSESNKKPKAAKRPAAKKPAKTSGSLEKQTSGNSTKASARKPSSTPGPKALVESLIDEGFFDTPQTIGAVQQRIKHKKGINLKSTALSPALVRLLRDNRLDRERDSKNQYEYSVPT